MGFVCLRKRAERAIKMVDQFGRIIDYARVSITSNCNLRCIYCISEEDEIISNKTSYKKPVSAPASSDDPLSFEHLMQVCNAFASLGISKIKITGGEPLLRKDIAEIIRYIKSIEGIEKVTLTTNGLLLSKLLEVLSPKDLDGINISIDSLEAGSYKTITRNDSMNAPLNGLESALNKGFPNIKINCVVVEGLNDHEIENIAGLAQDKNIAVRFIELMPISSAKQYKFVSQEQIATQLEARYGKLMAYPGNHGNGPAVYYKLPGFCGKIGFISAVSHKFCANCNRVRLTASGRLKTCLHFRNGIDLRPLLERNISKEELMQHIESTLLKKPLGHTFYSSSDASSNSGANSNKTNSNKEEHEEEYSIMSHIGG